jgi:hypothetical protein
MQSRPNVVLPPRCTLVLSSSMPWKSAVAVKVQIVPQAISIADRIPCRTLAGTILRQS